MLHLMHGGAAIGVRWTRHQTRRCPLRWFAPSADRRKSGRRASRRTASATGGV